MISAVAFLKARAGLTRPEFIEYYETHHAPLALSLAPAPVSYQRRYLPEGSEGIGFDVITTMEFIDAEQQRIWGLLAEDLRIIEDEHRFLDRAATVGWIVDLRS